jgi:peptidoglycan/xylan/chitin deacetylase (PgdA/CDA1 family)
MAPFSAVHAGRLRWIGRRYRRTPLPVVVAAAILASLLGACGSQRERPSNRSAPTAAASPGARPTSQARLAAEDAAVERLVRYGLPLYCGGSSRPLVALTFDDGPGVYTHYAIAKLRKHHLRATFFLVGKEIRAWPGLAQREKPVAAFGDHTMTHPFLPALPRSAMVAEIADAKSLIARTTGEPVVLFRPPYEGRNAAIDSEVRALGMLEVLWNVDSADSLGANYAGIERNVIAGLHPGSIILMHENRGQTIRALRAIFDALRRRHLRAVSVPTLIAEDPPSLAQLRAGGHGCGVSLRAGNGS